MSKMIDLLWQIASFADESIPEKTIFLTSTDFGQLATEVELAWPKVGKLTRDNFSEVIIGRLKFVNAGTEDQDSVDVANLPIAQEIHFSWKRDNLITGKL
jgi:hypothetical protein